MNDRKVNVDENDLDICKQGIISCFHLARLLLVNSTGAPPAISVFCSGKMPTVHLSIRTVHFLDPALVHLTRAPCVAIIQTRSKVKENVCKR